MFCVRCGSVERECVAQGDAAEQSSTEWEGEGEGDDEDEGSGARAAWDVHDDPPAGAYVATVSAPTGNPVHETLIRIGQLHRSVFERWVTREDDEHGGIPHKTHDRHEKIDCIRRLENASSCSLLSFLQNFVGLVAKYCVKINLTKCFDTVI